VNVALRGFAIAVLALLLWPEFARYAAEHRLAAANGRLERALRGIDRGDAALASVRIAGDAARAAAVALPGDPRPPLQQGIALILQGRSKEAIEVLDAAIAEGDRPELTINLGRARSATGDDAGAAAAYLRTAWASPAAISTLPSALRDTLQAEVAQREAALRAGQLDAPPPLR
jgi:predicted Zn-dependent protease